MDDQVRLRHCDYLADSLWLLDICNPNLYVTHTRCNSLIGLMPCYPKQLSLWIALSTLFHQVAAHKACTPCDEDARRYRHCFSATFLLVVESCFIGSHAWWISQIALHI